VKWAVVMKSPAAAFWPNSTFAVQTAP